MTEATASQIKSAANKNYDFLYPVLSIATIFLVWAVGAYFGDSRIFPGPIAVLNFVVEETLHGELLYHLGVTLLRVIAALVIAMFVGSVVGLAMGRSSHVDRFLDPWLIFFLNIPALVIIILAYVWVGLTEFAAVAAVAINKIPNVVVTLREGARSLDKGLDEMATTFRMTPTQRLVNVVMPQLQPYFAVALRSGISLIWKIVLVVELLGRSNGVGFQLHTYFTLFDVKGILGYTIAFIFVMLIVEIALVQPFERRATRWRPKSA